MRLMLRCNGRRECRLCRYTALYLARDAIRVYVSGDFSAVICVYELPAWAMPPMPREYFADECYGVEYLRRPNSISAPRARIAIYGHRMRCRSRAHDERVLPSHATSGTPIVDYRSSALVETDYRREIDMRRRCFSHFHSVLPHALRGSADLPRG